nr:hypothetical protein Iba_chr08dCG10930 [Ipomoea batatas]
MLDGEGGRTATFADLRRRRSPWTTNWKVVEVATLFVQVRWRQQVAVSGAGVSAGGGDGRSGVADDSLGNFLTLKMRNIDTIDSCVRETLEGINWKLTWETAMRKDTWRKTQVVVTSFLRQNDLLTPPSMYKAFSRGDHLASRNENNTSKILSNIIGSQDKEGVQFIWVTTFGFSAPPIPHPKFAYRGNSVTVVETSSGHQPIDML